MSDTLPLELAQDAINKGEKVKVIFQILLSELGLELEKCTDKDIWERLKQTQNDYEEACKMLAHIVHANGQKLTEKNIGVS